MKLNKIPKSKLIIYTGIISFYLYMIIDGILSMPPDHDCFNLNPIIDEGNDF